LVVGLIIVNISTVSTVRKVQRELRFNLLVMIEVAGTIAIGLIVILPLALGGLSPEREDLVPGILLSLGIAFLGTWVLVLTLFDIARFERSNLPPADVDRPSPSTDDGDPSAADHIDGTNEPDLDEAPDNAP
jgi:hypothetical protein